MDGKLSNDSLVQRIENRIHSVKQKEQEEREYMMFEMRLREEREEAKTEGKAEVILNMLKEHVRLDAIQRFTGWTADQIRALAQKNGLAVE